MKIHGSSTAASGMKKDWPESRRVSGNKRHDAIAVSGQKNKNEADRANDLVPAYRLSLSERGKELAALSKAVQKNDEGLIAKNPMAKQGVEQMALSDIEPWKPLRAEDLDWATQYERASLADRTDELADGMKAYKESLRTLHRLDDDEGEGADGKLSDKEKAEEKKHLLPSITAYDWQKISEKYLQENPELAAIFADNGMC